MILRAGLRARLLLSGGAGSSFIELHLFPAWLCLLLMAFMP